ncbi:hypothetical protein B4O97_16260 [Marispirochaeta aestuarii]|uniref:YopA central domain-containing protein n=1 Tax=Marispirochaeta aestuarii TaxID=1963862 RepID=A0A1Y1RUB3_9SPIO|nr:hypothetical protein [Marispirochaeta aestuarii]ORC32616.1 hypothetical protein B4O97_16260 [Marispirochaeta aestuarii]
MTNPNNVQLPDAFSQGPGFPVNLGTAKADFWIEDGGGARFKELKQIDVHGTQIFLPKDRVHLSLSGIPSSDVLRAAFNGTAFVQFTGQEPIQCLNHDNDENHSTWIPLMEPLDIVHSPDSGTRLEFVLFAFPVFYGDQDKKVKRTNEEGKTMGWWRCGQIEMTHEQWHIQITAHSKTKEWGETIKQTGGLAATHAGCIQKTNGEPMDWNEAQDIINCLHHFLSFARGHWQPIGNIRLLSNDDICLREKWGILRGSDPLSHNNSLTWWSPHPQAHHLLDVFKGFWDLWIDLSWKEVLPEVIYWYLQANLAGRGHLSADSALILSQSTLEKLSWIYATQVKKAVSEEAFQPGKLRASDQIRLLATLMDLPHEIPDILGSIKEDVNGQKFEDAFHAITIIRNQLVHSKKKRELKPRAEFDAWNLSQWYVEMCLLRLMKYQGRYANRVRMHKWAGETEAVPWAISEESAK